MNVYIVDASVVVKWFFKEIHREAALRVLREEATLSAPDFLLLETDNVLCKRIRRGITTPERSERIRAALRSYPIGYTGLASLQDRAYVIAGRTGRSVYDCLYVALAVDLGGRLVTADRRLYDGLAKGSFTDYVLWVEDVGRREAPTKRQNAKRRRRKRE